MKRSAAFAGTKAGPASSGRAGEGKSPKASASPKGKARDREEKSLERRENLSLKKLALAVESGKKGNYREAAGILTELISGSDAPPEAWLFLGRSFHALGDYSRALAAFNDYIRQRPASGQGYFFAGRSYLTLGMPYKAVPFLRKALEYSPGDSQARALLGTAYLKSKHSQAAVEILEEAVKAAPSDKRIYRAYLNALMIRGIRLCGLEDYEPGLRMLRFVLENADESGNPGSTLLRLELGRAARETGHLEEALEHFTEALKLAGDDRRIRWSRASILMALGRNAEARREIERIRSRDAGVPELPWNSELVDLFLIRSFLEAGEWRRAAESCRIWLRNRNGAPIIHALYAEALRNLRDYAAAHKHLTRALEYEPGEKEFWYADILVSWEGKDFDSLRRALKAVKSLGGDPGLVQRFTILCRIENSEDTRGNITMLQNAVRSLGPEPELMYALGREYLKIGLLEEAGSWFRKTVSLKENHESAWLGEISALEALIAQGPASGKEAPKGRGPGNPAGKEAAPSSAAEELGALYRSYLEKWPDNSGIRREWALFLVKTFAYPEAAAELEKLLVWEPSNPSLRRVLAYAYRKTGRYREAAVFLKALLKENPKDTGLLIEYSGCLEQAGAGGYAVAVLEKARELFRNSADIYLALGILSFRRKGVERAFDYLREAAALDTRDPRPYEWMAIIAKKNGDSGVAYYEREAQKRRKFGKIEK